MSCGPPRQSVQASREPARCWFGGAEANTLVGAKPPAEVPKLKGSSFPRRNELSLATQSAAPATQVDRPPALSQPQRPFFVSLAGAQEGVLASDDANSLPPIRKEQGAKHR